MSGCKIAFLEKDGIRWCDSPEVVVLSPSFYWRDVRRISLSKEEAKEAARSIFLEIVGRDDLVYFSERLEDSTVFYAYDPDEVFSSLRKFGADPSRVSKIIPMEWAFPGKSSVSVGGKIYASVEGTWIRASFLKESAEEAGPEDVHIPKKNLLEKKRGFADSFLEVALTVSATVFVVWLVQIGADLYALRNMENLKRTVSERYGVPETLMQTESVLRSLKKKEKKRRRMLEDISYILKTPSDFPVKRIVVDEKTAKMEFFGNPGSRAKNWLSKKFGRVDIAGNEIRMRRE